MDLTRSYTVVEVAEKLGISVHQTYRRINRGDLRATQVRIKNMHYRVSAEDLDAYITAGGGEVLTPVALDNRTMLTVPEVARLTCFTVETVRRMCYDGRLNYIRGNGPRGHLRIPRESVENYLAGVK